MKGSSGRSRWLELVAQREAARRGRALLEEKREALLRLRMRRSASCAEARARVKEALRAAWGHLREAEVEVGRRGVEAAALAQPPAPVLRASEQRLLGVAFPALTASARPAGPAYAPGGTAASLDSAVLAFSASFSPLIALAREEAALRAVSRGLSRTNRRISALERVVLPEISSHMRAVADAAEEEERDEAIRRRRLAAAPGGSRGGIVSGDRA